MIPLDIRIRYNVLQKNPMLSDIKTNYSLAYLIASEANTVLKTYYNKEISDDEIGFLALLFQIALEENSEEKKKKENQYTNSMRKRKNYFKASYA